MSSNGLKQYKIVTIGGGTGHFALLNGLKLINNPDLITALPGVTDNGGSSGKLIAEFGVLPPGDARQCLLALAPDDRQRILADWLNFRFPKGQLNDGRLLGDNLGNLNIAALEMMYGGQESALEMLQRILGLPGRIVPISLNKTLLVARLSNNQEVEGETSIDQRYKSADYDPKVGVDFIYLKDEAFLNPSAREKIQEADLIIFAPGDLYTSILPSFLVNGFANAIQSSIAKKIYCGNLMTKPGETDGFKAGDFIKEILKYLGEPTIDYIILNKNGLSREVVERYAKYGQHPIEVDLDKCKKLLPQAKFIVTPLTKLVPSQSKDIPSPVVVRHDHQRLAEAVMSCLKKA